MAESVLGADANVLRAIAATTDRQRSPPVVKEDETTEASPLPEHARTGWKKFMLMDRGEGEAAQEAARRTVGRDGGKTETTAAARPFQPRPSELGALGGATTSHRVAFSRGGRGMTGSTPARQAPTAPRGRGSLALQRVSAGCDEHQRLPEHAPETAPETAGCRATNRAGVRQWPRRGPSGGARPNWGQAPPSGQSRSNACRDAQGGRPSGATDGRWTRSAASLNAQGGRPSFAGDPGDTAR